MSNSAFLVIFIAVTALMAIVPFALRRLQIPTVISLLLVGIAIGPSGLDLIGHLSDWLSFLGEPGCETATSLSTYSYFNDLVTQLGQLGLMFLMALAGMEADFKLIRTVKRPVITLSIMTFIVPAIAGYLVYRHFVPDDLPGKLLYASLFASHSVGIVFPVIRDLKMSKTRFGSSVLISTVITDIGSIVLLAVSIQLFRQNANISHMIENSTLSVFDHMPSSLLGNHFIYVFLVIVLLYMVAVIKSVGAIGRWLVRHFQPGEDVLMTIMLLVILASVVVGELIGVNLVVGAFIAGLGLSKFVEGKNRLAFRRFETIGYGFLIPFLFVSIGIGTDLSVFARSQNFAIVSLTVVGLVVSKFLSGFASLFCSGFDARHSAAAGLMTIPQLSATLAAASIGRSVGMLSPVFFNAIVVLSIVTTLPVPTLVKLTLSGGEKMTEMEGYSLPGAASDDNLL